MYWLVYLTRSQPEELCSRVLRYFQKTDVIHARQTDAIAANLAKPPHETLKVLTSIVKGATLVGAERLYGIWLKRHAASTQLEPAILAELKLVLQEGKVTLNCAGNKVPLAVFLVVSQENDLRFLKEAAVRDDSAFVNSYASKKALEAAQVDLQVAIKDAETHKKAKIQSMRHADYAAGLEAEEILPYLSPLPKNACVVQLHARTAALMRKWMEQYPDTEGPCIAVEDDSHLARVAWEFSRTGSLSALKVHRGAQTDLAFLGDESVKTIFAQQCVSELHAKGDRKKIIAAFGEMDRVLEVDGCIHLVDDGTTPLFAYHLLKLLNYELIQNQVVKGILGSDDSRLLTFQKGWRDSEKNRSLLAKSDPRHWVQCRRTTGLIGDEMEQQRKMIQGQLALISEPRVLFTSHHFPRTIRAPLEDRLKRLGGLRSSYSSADIADLVSKMGVPRFIQRKGPHSEVAIMSFLTHALVGLVPNEWLERGDGIYKVEKVRACFEVYKKIDDILEQRQDIVRLLLEALEGLGPDKFRELKRDFENMVLDGSEIPSRIAFARKFGGAYLHELFVFGKPLMLLTSQGLKERYSENIKKHQYKISDRVELILDKCTRQIRAEIMGLVYHSPLRWVFFKNMGIKEEEILEARDPKLLESLLLFKHASQVGRMDDFYEERQQREILEVVAGKSIRDLLPDYSLDRYAEYGSYENLFRAYLYYGYGDDHLLSLVVRHANKPSRSVKMPMEILLQSLQDKNTRIQNAAVDVLGRMEKKGVLPALTKVLESTRNDDAKIRIIQVLVKRQDPATIPALKAAALDGNPRVRQQLARALESFGHKRARELLAKLCEDPQQSVRQAAQASLKKNPQRRPDTVTAELFESAL